MAVSVSPRSQGFAWEFRFYLTAPDGKRKLKVQTFYSLKYPTERDVRKAVEGQLSALNAGTLKRQVGRHAGHHHEDLLTLRHSTQTTNKSLINSTSNRSTSTGIKGLAKVPSQTL